MKMRLFSLFISLILSSSLLASPSQAEPIENKPVSHIDITFQNQAPGEEDETNVVLGKMRTKVGDPYNQETFDGDLKNLLDEYDWVEPTTSVEDGKVHIDLLIKKRPIVTKFSVSGASFPSKKIIKEAELQTGMRYERETFYKAINRIRDFYIKKGYFKAEVTYQIEALPGSNEITINIDIHEGPRGRINKIEFEGFTKEEEKAVLNLMRAKKFNVLTSWLTGTGTIKQEEIDPDIQTIVHYMQNEGYVDAHVTMHIEEIEGNKLALVVQLSRGEKYYVHDITFEGSTLRTTEELKKASRLQPGEVFSIDKIREAQEKVRELYTQDGYIHTHVDYTLALIPDKPEYDIQFKIEESNQYRVGLVMVTGNYATNKNVIYNNIDIEPGQKFDSRKIQSTQQKLMSTGYFKSVNVYPVKGDENTYGYSEYCDVMVEVTEAQTGNASLFVGFSSTDQIFGGIDFTENNFSFSGFRNVWTEGPGAFRGGGQLFQLKGTVGSRENGVNISWLNPYMFDTLWRFGVDVEYNQNSIVSKHYSIQTIGSNVTASYPISPFLSYGYRFRVKSSIIDVTGNSPEAAQAQEDNSGTVPGFGIIFGYDSTDVAFKPHRGIRSNFETEFAGLVTRKDKYTSFPFVKFLYVNSLYYPVWRKGTLKFRGDFKFIQPLGAGKGIKLPMSERFFLGGEGTVRGYSPGKIGPSFGDNEPKGGISSALFSIEYLQNIFKPIDVFGFFDAGSIADSQWSIPIPKMSTGVGIRLDIGRQLPFVVGYGYAINPDDKKQTQPIFFSMAGQF